MTNWACPLPNFCLFIGSDTVGQSEGSKVNCLAGPLAPRGRDGEGPGWARSNLAGSFEDIGFGRTLNLEGSFSFANSRHRGGSNFDFRDGSARYVKHTIDGSVYSRLLTPAGGAPPEAIRQSRKGDSGADLWPEDE